LKHRNGVLTYLAFLPATKKKKKKKKKEEEEEEEEHTVCAYTAKQAFLADLTTSEGFRLPDRAAIDAAAAFKECCRCGMENQDRFPSHSSVGRHVHNLLLLLQLQLLPLHPWIAGFTFGIIRISNIAFGSQRCVLHGFLPPSGAHNQRHLVAHPLPEHLPGCRPPPPGLPRLLRSGKTLNQTRVQNLLLLLKASAALKA
jgi:hypothetical protein